MMNADDLLVSENGEVLRFCECSELLIAGRRLPCPPGHDCAYVRARSALVPTAERLAFERLRHLLSQDDSRQQNARFTRVFAEEMERACRDLLRQKSGLASQ